MTGARSAATARQPLRRAAADRLLLGVCAGIARSLDLSPLAVRIAAVVLAAVAAPVVLAAYVIVAAIVPRDDGRALLGGVPADRRETLLGWSLVAAVVLAFAVAEFRLEDLVWPALSSFGVFAAAAAALALIALSQRRSAVMSPAAAASASPAPGAYEPGPDVPGPDEPGPDVPGPDVPGPDEPGPDVPGPNVPGPDEPGPDEPGPDGSGAHEPGPGEPDAGEPDAGESGSSARDVPGADAAAVAFGDGGPPTATMPLPAPPPPAPPRGVSLGTIGAGVLLIVGAAAFLLDAVGAIDPSATEVAAGLAAAAALAGAGAIAGAMAGRRGVFTLLALGAVLGAGAAGVGVLSTELDDGVGLRTERPVSVSKIPDTYRLGVGELDVDLRGTELPAGVTTVRAYIAVGDLTVLVPPGVRVESVGPTLVDGVARVNRALPDPQPKQAGKRRARDRDKARERAAAQPKTIRIDADVREGDADVVLGGP